MVHYISTGTTPRMGEVESSLEQRSRATQEAKAEVRVLPGLYAHGYLFPWVHHLSMVDSRDILFRLHQAHGPIILDEWLDFIKDVDGVVQAAASLNKTENLLSRHQVKIIVFICFINVGWRIYNKG